MRRVVALVLASLAMTSLAHAQEITPLANGWVRHSGIRGLSDVRAVACNGPHAVARSWGGTVVSFDGTSWRALPEMPDAMRGRTYGESIAVSGDGRIFAEASGRILRWDGHAWAELELEGWGPYAPIGDILAIDERTAYVVGRGRIARLDGARFVSHDAGTWRDLFAIAGTGPADLWTAGQGGTLMRWDGRAWARARVPIQASLDGLVVVSAHDAWAWSAVAGATLHWDGSGWIALAEGEDVRAIAASTHGVWAVTSTGVLERRGQAWAPILAVTELGEGYHDLFTGCASSTHLIVAGRNGELVTRRP